MNEFHEFNRYAWDEPLWIRMNWIDIGWLNTRESKGMQRTYLSSLSRCENSKTPHSMSHSLVVDEVWEPKFKCIVKRQKILQLLRSQLAKIKRFVNVLAALTSIGSLAAPQTRFGSPAAPQARFGSQVEKRWSTATAVIDFLRCDHVHLHRNAPCLRSCTSANRYWRKITLIP